MAGTGVGVADVEVEADGASRISAACADATAWSSGIFGRPRSGSRSVNRLVDGFSDDTDGLRPAARASDCDVTTAGATTSCSRLVSITLGTSSSTDDMDVLACSTCAPGGEYSVDVKESGLGCFGMSRGGDVATGAGVGADAGETGAVVDAGVGKGTG